MALILELPPELEARLAEQAAARGLDLAAYATRVLEGSVPAEPVKRERTPEEFDAWAAAMAKGAEHLPKLPTESFTRESFYDERG
jgi:hypothetical protein